MSWKNLKMTNTNSRADPKATVLSDSQKQDAGFTSGI
jgi:hypothetical protein